MKSFNCFRKLFVSHCEAFDHKLMKYPLNAQDGKTVLNIPLCPGKIFSVESDYNEQGGNEAFYA